MGSELELLRPLFDVEEFKPVSLGAILGSTWILGGSGLESFIAHYLSRRNIRPAKVIQLHGDDDASEEYLASISANVLQQLHSPYSTAPRETLARIIHDDNGASMSIRSILRGKVQFQRCSVFHPKVKP